MRQRRSVLKPVQLSKHSTTVPEVYTMGVIAKWVLQHCATQVSTHVFDRNVLVISSCSLQHSTMVALYFGANSTVQSAVAYLLFAADFPIARNSAWQGSMLRAMPKTMVRLHRMI